MVNPYITLYRLLLPRRYRKYLQRAGGDIDMCHETLLHVTYYEEYKLYDFAHKSDAERRAYLTDAVRNKICRKINAASEQAVVMDKYRTAQYFSDFYRRPFMLFDGDTSVSEFTDFASALGEVVAKPVDECAGRGVQLLTANSSEGWKSHYEVLKTSKRRYIVEERIIQAEEMSRWSDSVNTIRMNTLQYKGQVCGFTAFLRTGRLGSFVDNGAQGGLFASIDTETGAIITDAYDEQGCRYTSHPDSGMRYQSVQIPRWSELVEMTTTMAQRLSKVAYIGWDLALTNNGWVLVEANKGEFIAQQLTLGRGLRQEFLEAYQSLKQQ